MYIIGKASKDEIAKMIEQGWEVESVNQALFNKALDPTYDPKKDPDLYEPDDDRLVCVYTDQDVDKQLTIWHCEEIDWVEKHLDPA